MRNRFFEDAGVLPQSPGEISFDKPRRDAIRADVVFTPFDSKVSGKLHIRSLGDAINPKPIRALETTDGRNDHDAAATLALHDGGHHVAKPEIASYIAIHDAIVGLIGHVN